MFEGYTELTHLSPGHLREARPGSMKVEELILPLVAAPRSAASAPQLSSTVELTLMAGASVILP